MKNTLKHIFFLLLALLLFAAVSLTASATEIVDSGTCGENLTWTFDSDGTLTISGTGDMEEYYTSEFPWTSVREYIKKVIIEDGVENIPAHPFSGCTALVSITLADSVYFNTSGVFTECSSLIEINVTDENNSGYHSVDGVLYADFANGHMLVCYPAGKQENQFAVPDFVTIIEWNAFENCKALQKVIIPSSVNIIENYAFQNCSSLHTVEFGKDSKLSSIGEAAFENCTALTEISIPDSVSLFWHDTFRNTAYFNEESNWEDGVLYIGKHLLAAKQDISGAYSVKEGTKTIAPYAFYGCQNLTDVTIPDSILSIGVFAFQDTAIYNNADNWIDGCLYIDDHLIEYYYRGDSFSIKDGTKSIAMYALVSLEEETVVIPSSVTAISCYAFGHSSFSSLVFEENSHLTHIGRYAFADCSSLTQLNLPDCVKTIDCEAFVYCTSLTSVRIPPSMKQIGSEAFDGCTSLSAVYIEDIDAWCNIYFPDIITSPVYVCLENGEYSSLFLNDEPVTDIVITSSKGNAINDVALFCCMSLTKASIRSGITRIGKYAFFCNTALNCVEISKDVTVIDDHAFGYCFSLTDVYYAGSEEEWKAIAVGIDNDYLLNAEIHFNSSGEECSHVAGSYTQPESCTVNGYTLVYCELCGETLEYTIIEAAHKWGEYVETEVATCIKQGTESRTCERCGTSESRATPVTDHDFNENWTVDTDSTCSQEGVQTRHCKNCTATTDPKPVAKKDHTWGEWVVVTEPTLTSEGTKQRKCTACPETDTGSVPMLETKEFKDEKSGIIVETDKNAYNGQDITVTVEEVFDGSQFLAQAYGKQQTWNLKTYINGEQVQPAVPVSVRIPLPEDFNPNKIFVYHVNSQTNALEKLAVEIIDGYICFTTSSFSLFIIVDESSLITQPDEPIEPEEPDDPAENCDHMCHQNGFMSFIWKIIRFFWKLFGMNPVCECGAAHY